MLNEITNAPEDQHHALATLAQEVETARAAKIDYTRRNGELLSTIIQDAETRKVGAAGLRVPLPVEGETPSRFTEPMPFTPTALGQIATVLGIPVKYARRMATEAPELLATNLDHWLWSTPENVHFVRTLHGKVRAYLGSSYRTLDAHDMLAAALPVLAEYQPLGLQLKSVKVTDDNLYIQAVFPKLEARINPSDHTFLDSRDPDIIQAGVVISTNEVGAGTASVRPLIYRLVCRNGLIAEVGGFKRRHIGRRHKSGMLNNDALTATSDATAKANAEAFQGQVGDAVRACLSEETLQTYVGQLQGATQDTAVGNIQAAATEVAKQLDFSESEGGALYENLIRGTRHGGFSRYDVVQAVTVQANKHADYDRAIQLEELGGAVAAGVLNWPVVETAAADGNEVAA